MWSAILSTVQSMINGVVSIINTNKTNKTNKQIAESTNKANKELAEQQNTWNIEQWNRENEYNSPENQIQLLKNAGLNPLMYNTNQGSYSNSITSAPLANQMPYQVQGLDMNVLGGVTDSLKGLADYQLDKHKDEREQLLAEKQALKLAADTEYVQAGTALFREDLKMKPLMRKQLKTSIANLKVQGDLMIKQGELIDAEINKAIADVNKTSAETENIQADTKNKGAEYDVLVQEAGLKKQEKLYTAEEIKGKIIENTLAAATSGYTYENAKVQLDINKKTYDKICQDVELLVKEAVLKGQEVDIATLKTRVEKDYYENFLGYGSDEYKGTFREKTHVPVRLLNFAVKMAGGLLEAFAH